MKADFDVIVVGAGLAGLAAAETLSNAGQSVVVIEARNRAGGRVFTVRDAATEYPIEMGPEWVGATGALRELLDHVKADVRPTRGHHLLRTNGALLLRDDWNEMESLMRRIGALVEREPDVPLLTALSQCATEPAVANARTSLLNYVQGFHAADPARVSARWLMEVEENEPAGASEGHALAGLDWAIDALCVQLSNTASLRLNTIARHVRWSASRVSVETECNATAATYTAPAMVCTLPLAILKLPEHDSAAVKFTPPLQTKQHALSLLDTGPVVKIALIFDEPFWLETDALKLASFIQQPGLPIPTWWTTYPVNAAVLTGWVAGPLVRGLGDVRGDALLDVALNSMASALGVSRNYARQRLCGWHSHDWTGDPYARGGYSYVLAGGTRAHAALAEPLDNTLFFAGEATCGLGHNATMEGALQSGRRAAQELLACR